MPTEPHVQELVARRKSVVGKIKRRIQKVEDLHYDIRRLRDEQQIIEADLKDFRLRRKF